MVRRRSSVRETSATSGPWPSLGRYRQWIDSVMSIFLLKILTLLIRKLTLKATFIVLLHSHCTSASNAGCSFVKCRAMNGFPSSETSCLVIFGLPSRGWSCHSLVWTASQGRRLLGVLAKPVVIARWRMLCMGVLFCFVPGALCQDAVSLLARTAVSMRPAGFSTGWISLGGQKLPLSLCQRRGYFCFLLSSDWHEDTPCIQVCLQPGFSYTWVFHPVFSISLGGLCGRCMGASSPILSWLPGLTLSTVPQLSPEPFDGLLLCPWEATGSVLASAQCWGFWSTSARSLATISHLCPGLWLPNALGEVAGHQSLSLLLAGGFLHRWRQRAEGDYQSCIKAVSL